MFDFGIYIGKAEDFLRRHIKPKAVQEAEKRRRERKARDFGRRFTRGFGVAAASGTGLVGYGALVAPLGTTAMVLSGAAALTAAAAAMFWPAQRERGASREELIALVADAEEWLLERRTRVPGRVIPVLDAIFARLHDLHPCVERMDPSSSLAWELRRLLGDHLPRLVHSYVELPETVKDSEPELLSGLVESLQTLDEELIDICREASRDHLVTFQAQGRFIESRYKGADDLKSG